MKLSKLLEAEEEASAVGPQPSPDKLKRQAAQIAIAQLPLNQVDSLVGAKQLLQALLDYLGIPYRES